MAFRIFQNFKNSWETEGESHSSGRNWHANEVGIQYRYETYDKETKTNVDDIVCPLIDHE